MTSRKYKYENRPYTVEIHKNEIACVRLKAPVSFARTETVYETTERPDIIGFVLYEGLNHVFVPAVTDDIMKLKQEYGKERHIGAEVFDDIAKWIKRY